MVKFLLQYKWLSLSGVVILSFLAYFFTKPQKDTVLLTAKAEKTDLEITVMSSGELRAVNSIDIDGPSGIRQYGIYEYKIENLISEGSVVKKDDIVATLDKSDIMRKINEEQLNLQKLHNELTELRLDTALTLKQAREEIMNATYAVEQKKLEKEQSQYEAPAIQRQIEIEHEKAIQSLKEIKSNYKIKESKARISAQSKAIDISKLDQRIQTLFELMEDFTVKAPENGMLVYARDWEGRKKTVGSKVSVWNPTVATLPDLSKMESVTKVNEVDIRKIKKGQDVVMELDAQPGKKLKGKVSYVANIGEKDKNSDSKVFEVVIEVLTADTSLRPSMTTSNIIMVETVPKALCIPIEALFGNDTVSFVYINKGTSVTKQEVQVGKRNEIKVDILKGLKEEDEILLTEPENAKGMDLKTLPKNKK